LKTQAEKWVEEQAKITEPDHIYWCNGSDEEAEKLVEIGLTKEKINGKNIFHELNQNTFPNSFLHTSHPNDVARAEQLTFVCYKDKEMAGPNNNWMEPKEAKEKMYKLFKGCMRGRTMYVLPYMMGHPDSPYSKACVQITDSTYVAVSMRIMTRKGKHVLDKIAHSGSFVKGLHSVGEFDPARRFIMHYPEDMLVESYGSGYGGNALLGKKMFLFKNSILPGAKRRMACRAYDRYRHRRS
jgi:phosphoenolpyruvate carboxykinase (GTP)